jgi:hypothetical protein
MYAGSSGPDHRAIGWRPCSVGAEAAAAWDALVARVAAALHHKDPNVCITICAKAAASNMDWQTQATMGYKKTGSVLALTYFFQLKQL